MTGREKLKWVGHNFYALIVCFFYAFVGACAVVDACWRAFHGEWFQCGKDLLLVPICFGGAVLIWKFYQWTDKLFKKWIDKGPKT